MIDNADYIITNSYHCSVFSLVFQKKFGVIPLTSKDSGMNSRFDTLFEMFQMEKRFLMEDFSVFDTKVGWQSVAIIGEKIRN